MKDKFIILFIFIAGLFSQSAGIYVFDNHVDIVSDGIVSGVQMTLTHDEDFSIELEPFYISEYMTQDNSTILVIASESNVGGQLFSYSGDIFIEEIIVAMNTNLGIEEVLPTITYESDCDINNDNNVNVVDVVLLVNMIFDDTEFGSDINQDGFVNVIDIVAMINLIFYESFLDDEDDPECNDLDNDNICDEDDDCVFYDIVWGGVCMDDFGNEIECSEDMFECTDTSIPTGTTSVAFSLANESEIHFYLKDECSNIYTIEQGYYAAGNYTFSINGENHQTGWYEITLEVGEEISTQAFHICNPPSLEEFILGTWQLDYVAEYVGPNCEYLDREYFGPDFVINKDRNYICQDYYDIYNEECEVGEYIYLTQDECENAGFEWNSMNCWGCFNDVRYDTESTQTILNFDSSGEYFEFENEYDQREGYDLTDYECDGVNDYCNSFQENLVEKEFEGGQYTIYSGFLTNDIPSLILNYTIDFEIKTGYYTECYGCSEDEMMCNDYDYDDCYDPRYVDEQIVYIIEDINNNFMRLKIVDMYTDYYNGYYYNNTSECTIFEYSKLDSYSIGGCMGTGYLNYNPYATFDNGTCNDNVCPMNLRDSKIGQPSNHFNLKK